MKKILIVLILGIVILGLAGCSGGSNESGSPPVVNPFINANIPGKYNIGEKYVLTKPEGEITELLDNIEVQADLSLKFNFVWSFKANGPYFLTKLSDAGNTNIYIKDDQGTKYNHYNGDGAAYTSVTINSGQSAAGAFYFPKLSGNATQINFYDDDQGKIIGPIEVRR